MLLISDLNCKPLSSTIFTYVNSHLVMELNLETYQLFSVLRWTHDKFLIPSQLCFSASKNKAHISGYEVYVKVWYMLIYLQSLG